MNTFSFTPIGIIHTPYPQKFGIARQSGLVPAATGVIELDSSFSANAIRGLDGFDYLWVQFVFHQTINEGFSELVRPPRLGGKIKQGVLATRSPHRPNAIGLSQVKIEKIECHSNIKIHVSGVDFLDGTPVLDIKPYLPHIESKPDAKAGFTENRRDVLKVVFRQPEKLDGILKTLIEQTIAQDPRPAHQHHLDKEFVFDIAEHTVRFVCDNHTASIISVTCKTTTNNA